MTEIKEAPCLTTLLKLAELDLLAAKLEYADAVSRFTLSDEEKRVLYSLHLGLMSFDDADAALSDSSRVAFVYRAKNRFDDVCLRVNQFKADPLNVDYQNMDFGISRRFYEKARKLLTPAPAPPPKKEPERKPCRPYVSDYQLIVLVLIGLLLLCSIKISGKSSEIEQLTTEVEELSMELEAECYEKYEAGYAEGYADGYADNEGSDRP